MLRLALHGGLFSGKTTLADALVERGFQKVDYTGLLKTFTVEALKAIGIEVTIEEMVANKEKYRSLIIELGHVIGFDDGYGIPEIIERLPKDDSIVFDNVRFDAQYEKLIEAGFILVRLTTPMRVRVARAVGMGITRQEFAKRVEDMSETPLREFPGEIKLSMDGNIDDVINSLTEKVLEHAREALRQTDADTRPTAAESDAPAEDAAEPALVAATESESGS